MAFKNVLQGNPLGDYRLANIKKSWDEISTDCELSRQQVMRMVALLPEDIATLNVSTILKLKDKIGVDFIEYISGGEYQIVKK